jgi:hypothetical protein
MLKNKTHTPLASRQVRYIPIIKQHTPRIRRLQTRSNVVFPEPDGPSKAVRLPDGTCKSTPDNA